MGKSRLCPALVPLLWGLALMEAGVQGGVGRNGELFRQHCECLGF